MSRSKVVLKDHLENEVVLYSGLCVYCNCCAEAKPKYENSPKEI